MQKIANCLWFDNQAEEAVRFYTGIFQNSRILEIVRNTEVTPGETGTVLTVFFELEGQQFMALNGGPVFKFNEAISLMVSCQTQAELDQTWDKLIAGGGAPSQCGWLKDKYGLSWQVVPSILPELLGGGDSAKVNRVMAAVMKMVKLDIAELKRARDGA